MSHVKQPEATAGNPRILALLRAIEELPSIPETLIRILKILDDADSSASELAEVIRLDAPLTAKVLRLANSPYYSACGRLADTRSCISVLGFKTIRQIALCVSIASSLLAKCNQRRNRLDYRELWRHSVVTGVIAKELAIMNRDEDPEAVFTAGLLHDLGKFVIVLHAPAVYDQVIDLRHQQHRQLVDVEMDILGFDHVMAGEMMGMAWRFPSALTQSARRHHDRFDGDGSSSREDRTVALVSLANHLAHNLDRPASDLGHDGSFASLFTLHSATGITEMDLDERLPVIQDAIGKASAYLELA